MLAAVPLMGSMTIDARLYITKLGKWRSWLYSEQRSNLGKKRVK
jgi:hypothetical protein